MTSKFHVLGLLAAAIASSTAIAADRSSGTPTAAAPDAAAMWADYLATADVASFEAFGVLDKIAYDTESVDADKCAGHADELRQSVAAVPVSIALRSAAFLCAEATADAAAAERELQFLEALSRHAFRQAGAEPAIADPIRVLVPLDAYALLQGSGLDVRYELYARLHADRHFPFIIAVWDAERKEERRFRFDFVDTAYTISRKEPLAGYPALRQALAMTYIEGGLAGDLLAAVDHAALKAASSESRPEDKVAKLRRAAEAGGVLASTGWLAVCAGQPEYRGCADGLADALLPAAEEQHASAMVLLAFAHLEGMGVKRDAKAAWTLLDAAERIAPGEAMVDFTTLWNVIGRDRPLPAEAVERLERAGRRSKAVRLAAIEVRMAGKEARLAEDDLAFLDTPDVNRRGLGRELLARYYGRLGDEALAWSWTVKAAEAGAAGAKVRYAEALLEGREGLSRDLAKAEALLVDAAHDGDARAARRLAQHSLAEGRFQDAEQWLQAPAAAADLDAILFLAALYEDERPGSGGNLDRARRIYEALEHIGPVGAPARRALADMSLEGRGVPKDPARAERLLRGDADAGDHDSAAMLGLLYLRGRLGRVDEAEGRRLVERAIEAGNPRAMVDYASWLFHEGNTPESRAKALELWSRADADGVAMATNNYAWARCTSSHDDAFDPARGLQASQRLGHVDRMPPSWLDTLAACEAAAGNFTRAVELQETAAERLAQLDTARTDRQGGRVPGYRQRLALYREGKAYRGEGEGE